MAILKTYIVPHPPLIIPEVGKGEERKIQDTIDAYHTIAKEIASLKPNTIIISSPHAHSYMDYFHISPGKEGSGSFDQFGARNVTFHVNYDQDLVDRISFEARKQNISAGTLGEKNSSLDHGTMVPLYFINLYYKDYKLIRLSPSGLSPIEHYQFGKLIQSAIPDDKKVIWVASGDLSHKLKKDGPYGLAKEGPVFDEQITETMKNGDFLKMMKLKPKLCRKAAECGLSSFIMMAGFLDSIEVESTLLSYEGPFGVGYAVASFSPKEKNISRAFDTQYMKEEEKIVFEKRENEDDYMSLARASLEYYIRNNHMLPRPQNLHSDLTKNKAGVFVSLHIGDRLRGCVGTTGPTTSCIADEIISNAISAGTRDHRFSPVIEKELNQITYKVDVLHPPEPIDSEDQLDVKKYGVIVRSGRRSGLLLPNLEGIDTIEEQVSIAKQKAGIREYESVELERFEVIRHE